MSRYDIARLTFVMAGVYLLSEALQKFQEIVYWWGSAIRPVSGTSPAMTALPPIIPAFLLVAGLGFIIGSGRIAARFFPGQTSRTERILAIPALAYSVVGLEVFTKGLTGISSSAGRFLTGGSWAAADVLFLVKDMLLIVLGVGLFWGSHGLARIWSLLPYAGLRRQMGLCIHCGYDMTGNASGICPECGTRQIPAGHEPSGCC